MAWQNSASMMGNGVNPGGNGDAQSQGSQQQGTEYTLQGVMLFLQREWHRHERERNAWDIERQEMKSRISKLEGDGRTSKRLQESLGKHVKLLETALKKEREKVKSLQKGKDIAHVGSDAGSQNDSRPGALAISRSETQALTKAVWDKPHNSFLDTEPEGDDGKTHKQEADRDKSRVFLSKCVQELTYHIVPSTATQHHIDQEQEQQMLQNHQQQMSQTQQHPGIDDMFHHQQRKQMNQTAVHSNSSLPESQPPAGSRITELPPGARSQQPEPMTREIQPPSSLGPQTSIDLRKGSYDFPQVSDDQIEQVSHSYDNYGRQIPSRDENTSTAFAEKDSADPNAWDFDTSEEQPHEGHAPPEYSHHRPDTDAFPSAHNIPLKSPPRGGPGSQRRKSSSSARRQSDGTHEIRDLSLHQEDGGTNNEPPQFKMRYALRGHLDVVRSVIFTGGGSPAEPEICTSGDDGVVKRWIIPATYVNLAQQASKGDDLEMQCYFTHRGHQGSVMSLAASPASQAFSSGGRVLGDGWVFSGGQDTTVKVWERGRVDPKATLDGHTDAVWSICVLPGSSASTLGDQCSRHGGPDRILLASGAADGTILIWAVSAPPQLASPHSGSRRSAGGSRRANSVSSGSNFPTSPQPNTASSTPFFSSLVHRIERVDHPSPTCIYPLSRSGINFVVSYKDSTVLIYDTRTGEEIIGMASSETYDGTPTTAVNAIVATTSGSEGSGTDRGAQDEENLMGGATGSSGIDGVIISGHEDRFIRFFDANSGQCTYSMLAHPAAISALSLSPDGHELVSAGHDASLRFWSLDKRTCIQDIASHRIMRGEGVCSVVWSQDGRWVVSAGGDGVVKVFGRG